MLQAAPSFGQHRTINCLGSCDYAGLTLNQRHLGLDGAIGFAVSGAAPPPPPPPAVAPLPPAVAPSPSPYQRPPPPASPAPTAASSFGVAAARAAAARAAALDPTAAARPVAPPAAGLDILAAIQSDDDDDDDDMYGGLTDRAAGGAGQAAGAEEVWLDAEEAALFGEGPLFVEDAPAAAAAAVESAPASASADNYPVSVGWGEGLLGGGPAPAPALPDGGEQGGCAHKCADKQSCGHLCCKQQGGTRRKRARAPTSAPTAAAAAAGAAGSPAAAAAGAAVHQAANHWASRAPTPTSSAFWERFRAPETSVGEKRPHTPQAAELAPAPAPAFEFAPAPVYAHTPRAPAPPAAPASTPRPKPPTCAFLGATSVWSKPLGGDDSGGGGGSGGDASGNWWDVGSPATSGDVGGGGGSGGGGGGSGGGYAPPLAPSPLLLHGKKTALAGGGAVHQPPLPQSNPNPKAQPQSHPSAFLLQVHRLPLAHLPSSRLSSGGAYQPSSNELPARPHFSPQAQPRREVSPAASGRGEHPLPPPPLSAFAARPSAGPGAPTSSRIAVKRSGATPRSRAGPRDDTLFVDETAPPPPLPRRPAAAVAAAPPSVRKPPPDGAFFSEVRGNPFAAGVEPQGVEAAQLFGLSRRPASTAPIGRENSDWQFAPQPLAGVGGGFDGDDGRSYGGVGGGDEGGGGYRGVLPPAREDVAIGGSLRGLNRSARCDHEIGEVGGTGDGPWPAPMPRGSSSSSAAERARPLASRGTAPPPPHSADWLAAKSALPNFDNDGARVTTTGSSSLFSCVGGGRAQRSPRRLDAPPPPLAAAPPPPRQHPQVFADTGPRGGFMAASARGAAGRGMGVARGAAVGASGVAASGDGQGLQQFSAGVDAWFSSATSSKRKKARGSPPPHLCPHTHTSHVPNPLPGGTRARLRLARPAPSNARRVCRRQAIRSADDQAPRPPPRQRSRRRLARRERACVRAAAIACDHQPGAPPAAALRAIATSAAREHWPRQGSRLSARGGASGRQSLAARRLLLGRRAARRAWPGCCAICARAGADEALRAIHIPIVGPCPVGVNGL